MPGKKHVLVIDGEETLRDLVGSTLETLAKPLTRISQDYGGKKITMSASSRAKGADA